MAQLPKVAFATFEARFLTACVVQRWITPRIMVEEAFILFGLAVSPSLLCSHRAQTEEAAVLSTINGMQQPQLHGLINVNQVMCASKLQSQETPCKLCVELCVGVTKSRNISFMYELVVQLFILSFPSLSFLF